MQRWDLDDDGVSMCGLDSRSTAALVDAIQDEFNDIHLIGRGHGGFFNIAESVGS